MPEIWGYQVDQLIELPRDELGLLILQRFSAGQDFHPNNEALRAKDLAQRAGANFTQQHELQDAVASACRWLENGGYVVLDAGKTSGWMRVTKAGVTAASGAAAPRPKITLLSRYALRSALDDAASNFERGRFDAAVTLAMKALEVGVRTAAGLANADIGEKLMRKAFAPGGVLADPRLPPGENVGRGDLYAGVVGWWRHPAGHRVTQITDPQEAAEILLAANHLLRLADRASADKRAGWP